MAAEQQQSKSQFKSVYSDDSTTCAICHQTYTEPKCLPPPCTHVYCKTCIVNQLRYNQQSDDVTQLSFRCPMCTYCFCMQAEEVVRLKDDTFLLNLLQSSTNEDSEPDPVLSSDTGFVDEAPPTKCTSCDSGVSAVATCTECKATFCESCLVVHDSLKSLRSHHINHYKMTSSVEDEDESSHCTQHNTVRLSHYCPTCKVVVCSECINADHRTHLCVKLVQAAQLLHDNYNELNTWRDELSKICIEIIWNGRDRYEQAVDKVRDAMIEIINETAQDLKEKTVSAAFEQVRIETEALQSHQTGDGISSNHKSHLDTVKHRSGQINELKSCCQRLETLTATARDNSASILSVFMAANQYQKCALYNTCRSKFAMSNFRLGAGDEDDISDVDKHVLCLGSVAMLGLQQLQLPLNKTVNVGLTIEKLFDVKLEDVRLKGLCSNANGGLTVFDTRKKEMLVYDKSLLLLQVLSCNNISSCIAFFCVEKYVIAASHEKFNIYSSTGLCNCITQPLPSQLRYATRLATVVTGYNASKEQPFVSQVYSEFDALTNEVNVKVYISEQLVINLKYAPVQKRRVLEYQRNTPFVGSSAETFESVGNSYVPRVDNKLMMAYRAECSEHAVLINDCYAEREVIKFHANGNQIYRSQLPTDATISFQPFGMCIDDEGRVLIGDAGARTIHVISKNGDVVGQAQFGNMMDDGDTPSLMAYHGGRTLSLATKDGKIWIVQLRVHKKDKQKRDSII
jgi:hypothetical protein